MIPRKYFRGRPAGKGKSNVTRYWYENEWLTVAEIASRMERSVAFVRYRINHNIPLDLPDLKPQWRTGRRRA